MTIETLKNDELIETINFIPQSAMQLFATAVIERFKNPEEQRKFEEWKKKKTCKSCINRRYCWERTREYPCRDFKDMYSPKKDGKEK